MPFRYSVVVPVYNEAAVIGEYCRRARTELPPGYELLICYDFAGDNTLPAVDALPADQKPDHVRYVLNTLGKGVRYAIEAGMKAATAPVVLVMMADVSDDFSQVGAMIERVEAGADVVCASRYMKGGRQVGGPRFKKFLSRTAGLTLNWLTGLPTHDPTNSFKAYSKAFLDRTPIESTAGFCLGLELTAKAHFGGGRVREVPAVWTDRTAGESRFRLGKWLPHYLRWYVWAVVRSLRGGRLLRLVLLAGLFVLTFPPLFRLTAAAPPPAGVSTAEWASEPWVYGLNVAAARGMTWGDEVGFTYGPLGYTLLPLDVGNNLVVGTAVRLTLHVVWWLSVVLLLLRPASWPAFLLLLAASALPGLCLGFEQGAFERSALVLVATVNFLALAWLRRSIWPALVAVALTAFGLFVKFNIGVACASAVAVWVIGDLITARDRAAVWRATGLATAGVALAAAVGGVACGGLRLVPEYFRVSDLFASGYSSNVSVPGPAGPVVVAAVGLVVLAVYLAVAAVRRREVAVVLAILAPVAFVLYKSVAVRTDSRHWWQAFLMAMPLAGVTLYWPLHRLERAAVLAALTAGILGTAALYWPPARLGRALASGPHFLGQAVRWTASRDALRAAQHGRGDPSAFPPVYFTRPVTASEPSAPSASMPTPPTALPAAVVGPADGFPTDTEAPARYGLGYRPRFGFLGYCAFDPEIDARAARNFGPNGVPTVFYGQHLSDNAHPFTIAPACAAELLRWYRPADTPPAGDLMVLVRRTGPAFGPLRVVDRRLVRLGETIPVPATGGLTFLAADFRLAPLGRLLNLAYKVYKPTARVVYADGRETSYGLAWKCAPAGVFVGDLPRTLDEARAVFNGRSGGPVRSLRLFADAAFADEVPVRILVADRLPTGE